MARRRDCKKVFGWTSDMLPSLELLRQRHTKKGNRALRTR
jgi:hypothetical protein